jgi:hypothetical protein
MSANYPTVTYNNLEERFKSIAGLGSLETTDAGFLRQSVNRRIRNAYERYPWPQFTIVGESIPLVTADSNIIQTSGTSGTGLDLAFPASVVFRVQKANPTTTRYPEEYSFVSLLNTNSGSGLGYPAVKLISTTTLNSVNVFVTYRKELANIVTDGGTFTSGFFGDEVNDNPNIPYIFFEYVAFGAYADFLRGDGQTEKAQVEEQNAEILLRMEIDKVRNQSRQFRHDILQYRPSTQFRRHNVQAGGNAVNSENGVFDNDPQ